MLRIFKVSLGLLSKDESKVRASFAEMSSIAFDQMKQDSIPSDIIQQGKELSRLFNKTNDEKVREDIIFQLYNFSIVGLLGIDIVILAALLSAGAPDLLLRFSLTALVFSIPAAATYIGISSCAKKAFFIFVITLPLC